MKINNTTDSGVIFDVSVAVNGTSVSPTEDSNASGAKFFIRVSNKQNIFDVKGSGTGSSATDATLSHASNPRRTGLNGAEYML